MGFSRTNGAGDEFAGREGPRRVMDEDDVGRGGSERFEPREHAGIHGGKHAAKLAPRNCDDSPGC